MPIASAAHAFDAVSPAFSASSRMIVCRFGGSVSNQIFEPTTPVINYPEVAIVGVNKMVVRPVWDGTTFVPRKMMNLSCSFDHRVIDGWDAAVFVQRLKELLENPATLFVDM